MKFKGFHFWGKIFVIFGQLTEFQFKMSIWGGNGLNNWWPDKIIKRLAFILKCSHSRKSFECYVNKCN